MRDKSATTADETMAKVATDSLKSRQYAELRHIICSVQDGVVLITGKVSSFFLKQTAQQALMSAGLRVKNHLVVREIR